MCINADRKLCLNAGHTKTYDCRFSYRRPLPTPAAPPQNHSSKGSASAGIVLFNASNYPQYHRRAPPLATDRAVESTGGDHHLQQTAVVLAFGNHACAASNNIQGDGEEGNSSLQDKLINPATSTPHHLPHHHSETASSHIIDTSPTTSSRQYSNCVSSHVSEFYHITWSEIILPIEYHHLYILHHIIQSSTLVAASSGFLRQI